MREFDQGKAGAAADIEAADIAADVQMIEQQGTKARAPERGLVIDVSQPCRHPADWMVQEVTHGTAFFCWARMTGRWFSRAIFPIVGNDRIIDQLKGDV